MHDLRLVGVHDDGEHLLLSGADGQQYLLTVDESLRAAVRRDRAHLGQLQIEMSGELRPRDIQSQIRAGATSEEVAARGGWPVERVRRYEGAVLAERDHMTTLARSVTVRRRGSDVTAPTLNSRVEQRLAGRGVDLQQNVWDSWRAEDGPWMLTLRFVTGGRDREARWIFDPAARTVSAQDDEALWLSEDEKPAATALPTPHLSAVPSVTSVPPALSRRSAAERLYDLDADGGLNPPHTIDLDAATAASESREVRAARESKETALVGAMRHRRQGKRRLSAAEQRAEREQNQQRQAALEIDPGEIPSVKESIRESVRESVSESVTEPVMEPLRFDPDVHGEPPAAHPFPFPERVRPAAAATNDTAMNDVVETEGRPAPDSPDSPDSPESTRSRRGSVPRGFGPPPVPTSAGSSAEHPSHRRPRRASVPSWDEIMFGGKRD